MTEEHGGYLLLVEDSLDQREAMQAALEIEGYHVIAVPGGRKRWTICVARRRLA